MAITKILFTIEGWQTASEAGKSTAARMHRCEQMNAERWKLGTVQGGWEGVAKAVCMARTTACGLSNNYLPRLSISSLWGLRLHYASLSIGRRGKQSRWLALGRGASKAAAVACSKLFYERCKAFLIKTPLAQLMKVNNFPFPLPHFFPSKRRCRHMQSRQITFCVENNSLPFLSSPPLTGIKNNSSDKSRPSKKSIATVAALHNWAVGVDGGVCYCRELLSRLVV